MVASDVPQILINRELVLAPHQFDIELLGTHTQHATCDVCQGMLCGTTQRNATQCDSRLCNLRSEAVRSPCSVQV
jgi:hypothetical protein